MTTISLNHFTPRLLVIHPDAHLRLKLLGQLLTDADVVYLKFESPNLKQAFNDQIDDSYSKISTYHKPKTIILDECDNIPSQALDTLLQMFLNRVDPVQLILLSREVPSLIYTDEKIGLQTRIIDQNSVMVATRTNTLHAYGFGKGYAYFNGKLLEFNTSPLLRDFFFYILEHRQFPLDKLLFAFWLDISHAEAVAKFNDLSHTITDFLGIEFLQQHENLYRLNPEITLIYDVAKFRQHLANNLTHHNAETNYRKAYQLYRHDFLMQSNGKWIQKRREQLRNQQIDVCLTLGNMADNASKALGYYIQAYKHNPLSEETVALIMQTYLDLEMPNDALEVYLSLVDNLNAQSKTLQSEKIRTLASIARANCNA